MLTQLDSTVGKNGVTFLDLYQQENESSLVRAHLIARVTIGKDSISIALLNYDWLRKLSDQNKLNLPHERLTDGTLVQTASTMELQAFILNNANNKEAFGDVEVFIVSSQSDGRCAG